MTTYSQLAIADIGSYIIRFSILSKHKAAKLSIQTFSKHTLDVNASISRKSHITITRRQEDQQSKTTSSLFPIEMITKLEWTQSNAQQNIEHLKNPSNQSSL